MIVIKISLPSTSWRYSLASAHSTSQWANHWCIDSADQVVKTKNLLNFEKLPRGKFSQLTRVVQIQISYWIDFEEKSEELRRLRTILSEYRRNVIETQTWTRLVGFLVPATDFSPRTKIIESNFERESREITRWKEKMIDFLGDIFMLTISIWENFQKERQVLI